LWSPARDVTRPSVEQCRAYVEYVMQELRGVGEKGPARMTAPIPPRKDAARDDSHPLLSCLALIFLNNDGAFLQDPNSFLSAYEISSACADVLVAYASRRARATAGNGRSDLLLTEADTKTLAPELASEMAAQPALW